MVFFDQSALGEFIERGYMVGRELFSRDVASQIRDKVLSLTADNRSGETWKREMVLLHENFSERDWKAVVTPPLRAAIDDLAGRGRWFLPTSFGSWPVLFPGFASRPWRPLDLGWHVEGRTYEHWLDSGEIGITMIMFFSDVGAGDGGPAIAVGSHRDVARILARAQRGMAQLEIAGEYLRTHPEPTVVEGQGRAGDVLFMHPFTVHTRSFNVGEFIRVACNSRAALHERMRVSTSALDVVRSPVEQAIVDALAEALPTSGALEPSSTNA